MKRLLAKRQHLRCVCCGKRKSFLPTADIDDKCRFCGAEYPADKVEAARTKQQLRKVVKTLHPRGWKQKKPFGDSGARLAGL